MKFSFSYLFVFYLLSTCLGKGNNLQVSDCEVCFKVVEKIKKNVVKVKAKKDKGIKKVIRKTCKTMKNSKDIRFCYYIGGNEDSATGILNHVAGPIKNSFPTHKICEKLKKMDSQICDLKYVIPMDVTGMDLPKQRVKMLKKILKSWDEKCKGCRSKDDLVRRINEVKHLYNPKPGKSEL